MTPEEKQIIAKAKEILDRELKSTPLDADTTVRDLLRLEVGLNTSEQFGVILLDSAGSVLEVTPLFYGGLYCVQVDHRVLAAYVLNTRASQVILYHNHPSLSHVFSEEDFALTWTIRDQLGAFGVEVVDHYLVTTSITSMRNSVNWPGRSQEGQSSDSYPRVASQLID